MQPDDKLVAAFWKRTQVGSEADCWEWQGFVKENGYGLLSVHRSIPTVRAHRFSYMLHKGEIPSGLLVCHTCDNRKCVNPAHLYAGTPKDNTRDMMERGRCRSVNPRPARGSKNGKAKLNEEDVRAIIARIQSGESNIAIAESAGVSRRTIADIRLKSVWRHVWEEFA
jgi:hypothetical protein